MIKKRAAVWILLFVLVLTGCQDKNSELERKTDYTHISLFCDVDFWNPPQWETKEGTITGEISKKTNVAVDLVLPPQDADKQLSLMLVNDILPDVVSVTDSTVISQLVTSGKVWNLEEFFKEYLPDSHILKKFPQDTKNELIKRDGGWYAWPSHVNSKDARKLWPASDSCYEELAEYERNATIIWNRSLMKQLGLKLKNLQTEEQILSALEKAQQINEQTGEREIIPLLLDGQNYNSSFGFLQETFGAEYVDENGNYRDIILQPETKDVLYFLNQAMNRSYITSDQLTLPNSKIKEYMASGKVLCFIGNIANTALNAAEWVASGPILASNGKHPVSGRSEKATVGWLNTFISKKCEHPGELAVWLDYMTSEEGLLQWVYGEEGTDYILTDEGFVFVTEKGKEAKDNYTKTGVEAWWMFVNTAWSRSVLAPFEKGGYDEMEAQLHNEYEKSKKTKSYDTSLLDFSLKKNQQELENQLWEYEKSAIVKMMMAKTSEEFEQQYSEMIQKLEQMGIQKLNQIKNKQYQKNCQEEGRKIKKVN